MNENKNIHNKPIVATVVAADLNYKSGSTANPDDPDNVVNWIKQEKAKDKARIEKKSSEDVIKLIEEGELLIATLLENLCKLYQFYINKKGKINKLFKREIIKYCSLNENFKKQIQDYLFLATNTKLPVNYTPNDLFPFTNASKLKLNSSEIETHNSLTDQINKNLKALSKINF